MLKRLALAAALISSSSFAEAASSNVNSLSASGAIVGSQQLYCPTTAAGADLKCTFTQVDTFINAQFSSDFTVGSTGVATVASIGGKAVSLGAALTTTGTSATTLAFPSSGTPTYTFPAATATLLYSGGALGTPSSGTLTNATGLPIAGITGLGTGVGTALAVNVGSAGAPVVNGGALGTPSSGTLTSATGLPISTGVSGLGTGVATAAGNNTNASGGLATAAAPLTVSTGGTISGAIGYYVCTTTCAITLPTPAAGFQFCIRNDSAVTTVITISAITSVQFEKTTYNGYGTVTTGTMVSGGALGDKICLVGRDATHYLVGSYVGIWTNS